MPLSARHPGSPEAATRVHAEIDEQLDLQLFRALADSTRLKVLSCMIKCGRPCSVSEVAVCCDLDFSVVAKHLKILAAAGVLASEKQGRTVWYDARCGSLCVRFAALIDAIAEWCPNLESTKTRTVGAPCCGPAAGRRR